MRSSVLSTILIIANAELGLSEAQINGSRFPSSQQPVLAANFPDPCLIQVDSNWYAFSTSGNGKHIQVAASPSFLTPEWKLLSNIDALPYPGAWAVNDTNIWAPDVIELVSREYQGGDLLTALTGKWHVCYVLRSNMARTD